MKKSLFSILGLAALLCTIVLTSCTQKYSAEDIKGTWVNTDTTIEQADGQKFEDKLVTTYEFRDGTFTQTLEEFVDGEMSMKVRVIGTYTYDEPDTVFEGDTKAVGVISYEYDIESAQIKFADGIDKKTQESVTDDIINKFREQNLTTKQFKSGALNEKDKEMFYGLMVVSVDENQMVLENADGTTATFTKEK